MARIMVNGQVVDVPSQNDGMVRTRDVQRAADIPQNRAMVLMKPDGSNELVSGSDRFRYEPDFTVMDQPISERG